MADPPSSADKAIAVELFNEGRALLGQGRVGPACRKLEESQRLDPGGGTLLNVAVCHEREGRTATAWVEFTEALGIAKKDDRPQRVDFARTHLAQLEQEVSRLVIQVPDSADLPDLEIKRDGAIVGRAAWGSAVPVDPGDHVIEASAPGKTPWTQSVAVGRKADAKTVVVPGLENSRVVESLPVVGAPVGAPPIVSAGSTSAAGVPARSMAKGPVYAEAPIASSSKPSAAAAVIGWSAMGLGAAALGLGTYLGVHALSLKNDADRNCPNDACSASGASQNADAIRSANFATASFAAGAAGVGLGTILLLVAQSPSRALTGRTTPAAPKVEVGNVSFSRDRADVVVAGSW